MDKNLDGMGEYMEEAIFQEAGDYCLTTQMLPKPVTIKQTIKNPITKGKIEILSKP